MLPRSASSHCGLSLELTRSSAAKREPGWPVAEDRTVRVGVTNVQALAMSATMSGAAGPSAHMCARPSMPARTARRAPSMVVAWAMASLPWRCASRTAAVRTSSLMTVSPGWPTTVPSSIMILT